jgi:hypothetical protein
MNKKSHNKKRNVGIIYEQLILTISQSLVENNLEKADQAKQIIKRYFRKDTELYKEHKLFQALVIPEISDPSLATAIIKEAKLAARKHNCYQLEREKSRLIRDINYKLGKDIYRRNIKEYKSYATVQTLLNDWRSGSKDFERVVLYENQLHKILVSKKDSKTLEEHQDPEINNLVVSIMRDKFNKKYGSNLSENQANIIKQYVFSKSTNEKSLLTMLESIKQKTIAELKTYISFCESDHVREKITPVLQEVKEIECKSINDDTISKFLTLCQLREEIKEKHSG